MITAFTWAITALSLTGTALNVRKNILCFYLWAVGNVAWLGFDLWTGLYSGIFREIKTTEEPRFKKSESRKGSFEYVK